MYIISSLKNAGLFQPKFRTNPNVGLKMKCKNLQFKVKVEVGFLTQHLGLSIFKATLCNSFSLLAKNT